MQLWELSAWQWGLCAVAALGVGIAKTGVPGFGIVAVPLFASALGGIQSVGALLPLLIFADCFAVLWYRRHTHWKKLHSLFPWVGTGILVGIGLLSMVNERESISTRISNDALFEAAIGALVLLMLALHFLRRVKGEDMTPRRSFTVGVTGLSAGMATALANAAGPIMTLYLSGKRLPKHEFMGTIAVFFLLVNLSKFPFYLILDTSRGGSAMITTASLLFDCLLFPAVLAGVWMGRYALRRIPQRLFDFLVIFLAGFSAAKLLLSPWL